MRVASAITLTDQERNELEKLSRGGQSSIRARERSLIVLRAADGFQNKEIAQRTGIDRGKVGRWRQRYASKRLPGILKDKSRPGGIPAVSKALRSRIVKLTLHSKPRGATHWSRETMARRGGSEPLERWPYLGRSWFEAPSGQDLQALQRSVLRGEA
jgi:Homeodomain-like domain